MMRQRGAPATEFTKSIDSEKSSNSNVARIFDCRQQLQPDGVALQSSQPEHPLQRYRKIPAAFQMFSGKPATEENCHPGMIMLTISMRRRRFLHSAGMLVPFISFR